MITEFIETAGVVAYPLLLAAFLMLFIIFERTIVFILNYRTINKEQYLKAIEDFDESNLGDNILHNQKGIAAKIYYNTLKRNPQSREEFKLYLDAEEVDQLPELEKRLGFLNFIAQVAPTLGLLGTVSGMIKTFQVLGLGGNPEQMALGISEALFTTAAGLIISLPAAAFYHYFYAKIEKLHNQLNNLRLESESMLFKKEIEETTKKGLKKNELSA
ncbi:biopolymer transport protein ExbB [Halanaerobium congolense]|jgi:biopolymer transport protein ExbB|uniref:Biopolymer transport protein ExbB n=2 Tax=Halanaerobium TaxID=2330 RepID=A0A1G6I5Z7_9FIRM|nr:MotA/TolQ/ExbB proton channel family protein [Halanaerobium congolense]KXS48911.1 MAG: biopolymer transport protein ExbB [Halanaerobium sp. T82-1]OEG62410.1 MAG: flagellar motor protein MotA [Halanaerobium sp. MDAL1]PUU91092.1 MAG: biopolymer transport protein ExbB [Halanaerobium sp.]PTX17083.1 biopolymer transport protein ExbB [Halanaerobium congolense]TDX45318.1 biopolymer transport protein ExbB [Halanaerobium congolense]